MWRVTPKLKPSPLLLSTFWKKYERKQILKFLLVTPINAQEVLLWFCDKEKECFCPFHVPRVA